MSNSDQHPKTSQTTKAQLRKMMKSGKHHLARDTSRVAKYGAIGFVRNIWLSGAATLVMTVTLIVLFFTVAGSVILTQTADDLKQKIDLTVFLKPQTSGEVLRQLSTKLYTKDNVKLVKASTSEMEFQRLLDENRHNPSLLNAAKDAPVQERMNATLYINIYDANKIDQLKNFIEQDQLFTEYLDPERPATYNTDLAQIKTVTSWAQFAQIAGLVLSVVFLVISVFIILNTVRMAIFSRREEIYMMKLIGASSSFTKGPFLIEVQICGIIAGLLAALVSYYSVKTLAPGLHSYGIQIDLIEYVLTSKWALVFYAVMLILGISISTISARLAISKYLK